MSTYKLYYYDSRGTGEPIRIIFAQAGVNYEDIRFQLNREQLLNEPQHQSKMYVSFLQRYYDCILPV